MVALPLSTKKAKKTKTKEKEMTKLGYALRAMGGIGGSALGNLIGQSQAGGSLGRSIGATLSKWLGSGDYQISKNSLITPSGTIPMMHNEGQTVVVRHKEFITQISGSTDFVVQRSLVLNPGLEGTFPWLSKIARSFQEYRVRGMVFHYIPSSGNTVNSTNPALGTVMFQTSYRSTDSPPTSKLELCNEYWSSENVPSEAFCHPIECDPKENPFNIQYVRTGELTSQSESKLMYDLGQTHIAVSGQQSGSGVLGDVWVTYEVELKKPILASNATTDALTSITSIGAATTSDYFVGSSTTGSLAIIPAVRKITFPVGISGVFSIMLAFRATTASFTDAVLLTTSVFTNCSRVGIALANTDFSELGTYMSAAGGGQYIYHYLQIKIPDPSKAAVVDLGVYTWVGTVSNGVMYVNEISPN